MKNFDILLNTIETLRTSQGFYSRLARDIQQLDESGREKLKEYINGLPQWTSDIDCILWLEG